MSGRFLAFNGVKMNFLERSLRSAKLGDLVANKHILESKVKGLKYGKVSKILKSQIVLDNGIRITKRTGLEVGLQFSTPFIRITDDELQQYINRVETYEAERKEAQQKQIEIEQHPNWRAAQLLIGLSTFSENELIERYGDKLQNAAHALDLFNFGD